METIILLCDDCHKDITNASGGITIGVEKQAPCTFCKECMSIRLIKSVKEDSPFKKCPDCFGRGYRRVEVSFDGHRADYEDVQCSHFRYKQEIQEKYEQKLKCIT